jgi:hypothetical protein
VANLGVYAAPGSVACPLSIAEALLALGFPDRAVANAKFALELAEVDPVVCDVVGEGAVDVIARLQRLIDTVALTLPVEAA